MTTKPRPLSYNPLRVGKITISRSPHTEAWRIMDCRRGRYEGAGNDLYALSFAEALDRLRKIEAREMAERVTTEPTA